MISLSLPTHKIFCYKKSDADTDYQKLDFSNFCKSVIDSHYSNSTRDTLRDNIENDAVFKKLNEISEVCLELNTFREYRDLGDFYDCNDWNVDKKIKNLHDEILSEQIMINPNNIVYHGCILPVDFNTKDISEYTFERFLSTSLDPIVGHSACLRSLSRQNKSDHNAAIFELSISKTTRILPCCFYLETKPADVTAEYEILFDVNTKIRIKNIQKISTTIEENDTNEIQSVNWYTIQADIL